MKVLFFQSKILLLANRECCEFGLSETGGRDRRRRVEKSTNILVHKNVHTLVGNERAIVTGEGRSGQLHILHSVKVTDCNENVMLMQFPPSPRPNLGGGGRANGVKQATATSAMSNLRIQLTMNMIQVFETRSYR